MSDVARILTGSTMLDCCLGGGVGLGRLISVSGQKSTGKCLTADTYVASSQGLLTVAELFERQGIVPDGVEGQFTAAVVLQNRYGGWEDTTHLTKNGYREVVKIKTARGTQITNTLNHPHLVMNAVGELEWRPTEQLQIGDYLVLAGRTNSFGPHHRDLDEMYLLGLLIADGVVREGTVWVTNDDPCVKSFIEGKIPAMVGARVGQHPNNDHGSIAYHFSSRHQFKDVWDRAGLRYTDKAGDKEVPIYVRESDESSVRAFLQGYLDSESSCTNGQVEVTSKSWQLLHGVKLLLQQFGIIASIRPKHAKDYPENAYWRLYIGNSDALQLRKVIGSRSKRVTERWGVFSPVERSYSIPNQGVRVAELMRRYPGRPEWDKFSQFQWSQPYLNVTYSKLAVLLGVLADQSEDVVYRQLQELNDLGYRYEQVESIESVGTQLTFDFSMSSSSSFVANGLVTHNTQIAIELAANFAKQYPKGKIWYVDSEAAFDAAYAEQLGLPVDRVDFLEDVETVEDFSKSITKELDKLKDGAGGLYVLDSIDALSTDEEQDAIEAQLKGTEEKGTYGMSKAKELGKFFRNTVKAMDHKQVSLLGISQLREMIGATFKTYKKSGGMALDYYSSQSVVLKKTSDIEPQRGGIKRVTGVIIKATVEKNKLGKPFRECTFPIMFDYGIDDMRSCLEFLKEAKRLTDLGALAAGTPDAKTGELKPLDAKSVLNTIVDRLETMLDKPDGVTKFNEASKLITTTASAVWYDVEKGFGFNRPGKY